MKYYNNINGEIVEYKIIKSREGGFRITSNYDDYKVEDWGKRYDYYYEAYEELTNLIKKYLKNGILSEIT